MKAGMHMELWASSSIICRLMGQSSTFLLERKLKKQRKVGRKEGREERWEGRREGSRRQASCYIPHKLFQEMTHIIMDQLFARE